MCKVDSDFSSIPLSTFKLKNRHWWNKGEKYHRINYAVKVNLGPADISFELWHNGVKLSKDNTIKVEWQAAAPPDPSELDIACDVPMSGLPAVVKQEANFRGAGINRWSASTTDLLRRKPVETQMEPNGHGHLSLNGEGNGNEYAGGGVGREWDNKTVQTHIMPLQQHGSTVW
jgi:hypothetical protein